MTTAVRTPPTRSPPFTPDLAAQFPNAEIIACNLSDMAKALAPHRDALPVVKEEIGDTWIYGVASDPMKVARYREVARLREHWIAAGRFKVGDSTDVALLRRMLLEPEHTWGTDTKTWLDFDNYKPADLERMLDTKNYKVVQFSWQEKRQDLLDAVAALPESLRTEAQKAIENLKPAEPPSGGRLLPAGETIETAHFVLGFDPKPARSRDCATKRPGTNGRVKRIRSHWWPIRHFPVRTTTRSSRAI